VEELKPSPEIHPGGSPGMLQDSPVVVLKPDAELHPDTSALAEFASKINNPKTKRKTNKIDVYFFIILQIYNFIILQLYQYQACIAPF
jgi:hypothetical protein